MNEFLNVMDLDETLKGSYIVMGNASIHKSKPILRKIESKGYKVMYLPPYSPELNPIEQFWAMVKGKMKRDRLMSEENLSSRIIMMYSSVIFIAFVITLNAKSLNAIIKHRSNMRVFLSNKCLFFKRQTSMTNFTANFS